MRIARTLRGMVAGVALATLAAPAKADGDTQLWNTRTSTTRSTTSGRRTWKSRSVGTATFLLCLLHRSAFGHLQMERLAVLHGRVRSFRVWDEEGDFADEDRIWEQFSIRLFGGKDQPTPQLAHASRAADVRGRRRHGLATARTAAPDVSDRRPRAGRGLVGGFWRLNDVTQANGPVRRRRNRAMAKLRRPQFRSDGKLHVSRRAT